MDSNLRKNATLFKMIMHELSKAGVDLHLAQYMFKVVIGFLNGMSVHSFVSSHHNPFIFWQPLNLLLDTAALMSASIVASACNQIMKMRLIYIWGKSISQYTKTNLLSIFLILYYLSTKSWFKYLLQLSAFYFTIFIQF